jgi:chemotaxis protein CheZ
MSQDSFDVDDLFAAGSSMAPVQWPQPAAAAAAAAAAVPAPPSGDLYHSIGQLVRRLHDALREVGQESVLFKVDEEFPASRARLGFIGDLMEKSATECIQLAEEGMPKLDESRAGLEQAHAGLVRASSSDWHGAREAALSAMERSMAAEREVKDGLFSILMAQGFQDLAGQTLGKVMAQVASYERELLELLALASVDAQGRERISEFLEGPQYDAAANEAAVASQVEVDDLLKDLGF